MLSRGIGLGWHTHCYWEAQKQLNIWPSPHSIPPSAPDCSPGATATGRANAGKGREGGAAGRPPRPPPTCIHPTQARAPGRTSGRVAGWKRNATELSGLGLGELGGLGVRG